jgi:hypothetical protein
MRARPSSLLLVSALASLSSSSCAPLGERILDAIFESEAGHLTSIEPIPAGALRASSRDDIVQALTRDTPDQPASSCPLVVATFDEVIEACPALARQVAKAPVTAPESYSTDMVGLSAEPPARTNELQTTDDTVRLVDVTLRVEVNGNTYSIRLGAPTNANGCVYGFLKPISCTEP